MREALGILGAIVLVSAVVPVAAALILFFVIGQARDGGLKFLAPIALVLGAVAAFGYLVFGPQPDA